MRAVVTGATGFIGSAIARRLLARGQDVRVLVRQGSDTRNIDALDVEVVRGDIRDRDVVAACLSEVDYVFHAAADYRLWVPDPDVMYSINVEATRTLMEACVQKGISKVVYTSSVATLGLNADSTPADETNAANLGDMIGSYKRSKFLAEQAVRSAIDSSQLPAVIVYPTAPVGPHDVKPTPTGQTLVDAGAGRMPAYVNTGLNIAHVDDVAEGHVLALERGEIGEGYILGNEDMTLREILQIAAEFTGRKPPSICLPHKLVVPVAMVAETFARISGRPARITRDALRMAKKMMYFSSEKARRELGYAPRPAREAIHDAIDWFRENGYFK